VFAFRDAKFAGTPDASQVFEPLLSITASVDGKGYWLAAVH
jgi:hypothetical protein